MPCGSRSLAQMSLLFGQVVRGVSAVGRVFEVIMPWDIRNQFKTSTHLHFDYSLHMVTIALWLNVLASKHKHGKFFKLKGTLIDYTFPQSTHSQLSANC